MLTIFDFDGTLCDSREAIILSLAALFEGRCGQSPPRETLDARVREGRGLTDVLRSLHPDGDELSADDLAEWEADYRGAYGDVGQDQIRAYDGAADAVRAAADVGDVAVVSMKCETLLRRSVEDLGFADHVGGVFGDLSAGGTRRVLKPDASLFHDHIAPAFDRTDPGRTVMIGDTPGDLAFARNAGLASVWASYGYGEPAACRDVGFDAEAASPADITAAVRRFAAAP